MDHKLSSPRTDCVQDTRDAERNKVSSHSPGGREAKFFALLTTVVATEWRHVLGIQDIDDDAGFFDLGGESRDAVRLHTCIESATRRIIPLAELFAVPTIAGMTAVLRGGNHPIKSDTVIAINSNGTKPALFCIASPEVDASAYAVMLRRMDPDQASYVVQAPPVAPVVRKPSLSEIPAIASAYCAAILEVQPTGPYNVIGGSFGAHLAVEIAKKLVANEQQVTFLGVIDTWARHTESKRFYVRKVHKRVKWYVARLRDLAKVPAGEMVTVICDITARRLSSVARWRPTNSESVSSSTTITTSDPEKKLHKYQGKLSVFRVAKHNQSFWRVHEPALGWHTEAQQVEEFVLKRGHHTTLAKEPYVTDLAEMIQRALDIRCVDNQHSANNGPLK